VIHENASNINGVFFKVVEGANSIQKQEGSIIDLRGEADLSAVGANTTLPNVIKHIVRLKRVAGNEHFKQLLMDGRGGQADDLTLQFAIDDHVIGPAGGEVEDRLEEVVGSIMVSRVEYSMLDIVDGQCTEVRGPSESREAIGIAVGCFKRSLIYKGCSNQLMSTSTEQGKKVGVFSCQNPREIWLDRST
jgi:hypothetical protein